VVTPNQGKKNPEPRLEVFAENFRSGFIPRWIVVADASRRKAAPPPNQAEANFRAWDPAGSKPLFAGLATAQKEIPAGSRHRIDKAPRRNQTATKHPEKRWPQEGAGSAKKGGPGFAPLTPFTPFCGQPSLEKSSRQSKNSKPG
jgi:hypothetical protein